MRAICFILDRNVTVPYQTDVSLFGNLKSRSSALWRRVVLW